MGAAGMTLQEAADLLGVHYMTAYRYVRLGVLDADKVGGTWRVTPDAVEACRASVAPSAGPAAGSGGDTDLPVGGRRRAPWSDRLEQRLLAGDGRGAWGVVESAMTAGTELDEVYLEVLAPAMRSIGQRWSNGEIDVAQEHLASGIATRIIGRLGPRFSRRGRSRGTVLLGAPAGERHALPLALVADLVRLNGWEVSDLGADTPPASFALAASATDGLVAVGISITTPDCLDAAAEALAAVRAVLPSVPLLAGGHAVPDAEHAQRIGADLWASDARSVVRVLEEIAAGRALRTS